MAQTSSLPFPECVYLGYLPPLLKPKVNSLAPLKTFYQQVYSEIVPVCMIVFFAPCDLNSRVC